jgi:hypothetical protein
MSRATSNDKVKPMSCIIMKRRPPLSTSAPAVFDREAAHGRSLTVHRRASNGGMPSRILFQRFWRLLYVSRILFAFSQRPAPARQGSKATSPGIRCGRGSRRRPREPDARRPRSCDMGAGRACRSPAATSARVPDATITPLPTSDCSRRRRRRNSAAAPV